jgi:hypothetical protein
MTLFIGAARIVCNSVLPAVLVLNPSPEIPPTAQTPFPLNLDFGDLNTTKSKN